jgi:hypothetical protein
MIKAPEILAATKKPNAAAHEISEEALILPAMTVGHESDPRSVEALGLTIEAVQLGRIEFRASSGAGRHDMRGTVSGNTNDHRAIPREVSSEVVEDVPFSRNYGAIRVHEFGATSDQPRREPIWPHQAFIFTCISPEKQKFLIGALEPDRRYQASGAAKSEWRASRSNAQRRGALWQSWRRRDQCDNDHPRD